MKKLIIITSAFTLGLFYIAFTGNGNHTVIVHIIGLGTITSWLILGMKCLIRI